MRAPKQLAVIQQTGCTGCEVCLAVCPVDCIEIVPSENYPGQGPGKLVEVDLSRCIGCSQCAIYCPWDTIRMMPYAEGVQAAPAMTLKSVVPPENLK